jgi:zinc transport system substrate-binding protein
MDVKKFFLFIFILLISFVSDSPGKVYGDEKIPVIASIFPVADMVKQVGGDYVNVMTIIPPGASPHTFTLKPSQVKAISAARIYFAIGAGLEIMIDKFIPEKNIKRVILSEGIPLIYGHDPHDYEKETRSHQHQDIANPHIWLDPQIAKYMADKIVNGLSEIDSENRPYYQRNGNRYQQELDKLDLLIKNTVSQFTIKQYVSFHPAWVYFSRRYGLEPLGIIQTSPGMDPTLQTTMNIVNQIKSHHIRAVFAEPQFNPRAAEVIAKEANARVLFLDPIGGPDLEGRNTYINLMKYNLNIMQEAMR